MATDNLSERLREVACPACSRRIVYSMANRWRPFYSERCRMVDLGAWASERFRIAGSTQPEDAGADPVDPASMS
jgi:endogenous inhibitor of DNA gyrase (YacG/DUF329 family)